MASLTIATLTRCAAPLHPAYVPWLSPPGALRHGSPPMFPGYHPQVRCAMAACGEEFTVVRSGTPSN
eukprot:scaffold16277_cov57-Phaeocystis_antarctica.AAC.9